MLAQKNRFHRRNHLAYVHRKGQSQRGGALSIRYVTNQDHENYRVAVVVSKKVSKKAVVRNRIRRRLYATIRQLDPPLKSDVDLIISVFDAQLSKIPKAQLNQQLVQLLDRAKLRKA